jgi:SNF2 family DNA or RNA helicase
MKTLLPHQIEDAAFLASRKFAGNFSGMGSGKTLSALQAIRLLIRETAPHRAKNPSEALAKVVREHLAGVDHRLRVIIVGPPISLRMWQQEFEDFFPAGVTQLIKTGKAALNPEANAYIMSYDIATKRAKELSALRARVLICDESHALKSVKAKRTKAILGHGGLATSVEYAWMLTGTPSTRWNDDLYPFFCRADLPGVKRRCGGADMDRFRLRFCITQRRTFPGARYPTVMTVGNRNTDELNEWLFEGGLAVRRELADVWAAMPPLTINRLQIDPKFSPEVRALLKMLDTKTQREIEHDLAAREPGLSTLRRQLGESKVSDAVKVILERVESGAGALLVGAWHTDVIDALAQTLHDKDLRVGVLDGRTSAADKGRLQDQFNAGQLDVLVGQIAAMGVSLNLQHGGNRILVVEEDWSPDIMDQFFARLHRIGQTEHVHVEVLVTDTKLDSAIARIAGTKRKEHVRLLHQEAV